MPRARAMWPAVLCLALGVGCGAAAAPLARPAIRGEARARVGVRVPDGGPGRLVVGWVTGPSLDGIRPAIDFLGAAEVRAVEGGSEQVIELEAPPGEVTFGALLDRSGQLMWTHLGAPIEGNARGATTVTLRPGATAELRIELVVATAPPPGPTEERCAGPRHRLVIAEDAGVAGTIGNPTARRLCVFLPPSYEGSPERRYPVIYVFPGLMGTDLNQTRPGSPIVQRADVIAAETGVELILVGVDTSSRAGSTYLVDSPLTGAWERFATTSMIEAIDSRFRTLARADARAVTGHSTGGFNSMSIALRHPELFGVVASSSPDALDLEAWLFDEHGDVEPLWLGWMRVEDAVGVPGQLSSYAADWSPDASAARGFLWPVDLESGARIDAVWARWAANSPIEMLRDQEGLARARRLSGHMFLTCGRTDEARLFEPTERFHEELVRAGIEHEWVPTEGGHLDDAENRIAQRMAFLAGALPRE